MKKMSPTEITEALSDLVRWTFLPGKNGKPDRLAKNVKTGNFLAGLSLVIDAAVLAEKLNHHPEVMLTYPRITFILTTQDMDGVTELDVLLAKELDNLLQIRMVNAQGWPVE